MTPSSIRQAMLQCGHLVQVDLSEFTEADLFQACPHCGKLVKLMAVECREWSFSCSERQGCRVKWFSTQREALTYADGHRSEFDHMCSHNYTVYPKFKKKLRELLPRSIKVFILDAYEAKRYPESRSVETVDIDEGKCPF